jgi:hypothetical protein
MPEHATHDGPLIRPWQRHDRALVRELTFKDFAGAMEFVERVAREAVDYERRPDMCIEQFNHVRLTVSTSTTRTSPRPSSASWTRSTRSWTSTGRPPLDRAGARPTATPTAVTSLLIEHFEVPDSTRGARVQELTRHRAHDELAGRTVWAAGGVPQADEPARGLRARLSRAGEAVERLEVTAEEPLHRLAQKLHGLMRRGGRADERPDGADGEVLERGVQSGEELVGDRVRPGDVVVLHDALAAVLAQAIRDRGAHAVWHVAFGETAPGVAWTFMRDRASPVDAYVVTWLQATGAGRVEQRLAAVVPCADIVAAKEVEPEREDVGWSSLLADVVRADRHERVGGRRHARPDVAVR